MFLSGAKINGDVIEGKRQAAGKFTWTKRILIPIHVRSSGSIGEWKNRTHFGARAIWQSKQKEERQTAGEPKRTRPMGCSPLKPKSRLHIA